MRDACSDTHIRNVLLAVRALCDHLLSKENARKTKRLKSSGTDRRHHLVCYKGETLSITQWSKRLDISMQTLRQRLLRGWSVEDALGTPTKHRKSPGQG